MSWRYKAFYQLLPWYRLSHDTAYYCLFPAFLFNKGAASDNLLRDKNLIFWVSLSSHSWGDTALTCLRFRHFTLSLTRENSQTHTTELVPDVIRVVAEGHTAQRHFPQSAMHSNVVTFCTRKHLYVKCSSGDTNYLLWPNDRFSFQNWPSIF